MGQQPVRIGFVGAGENTRLQHIPGFRAIPGVELVSVCNRTRASSERVARQFGIPRVYESWEDLVDADDTNAICIGTWPNMHCPVTLRALERGKHVLTEARMAMNAAEARLMLEAARRRPHLVAQVVPCPASFWADRTVQELLAQGFVGDVLVIEMAANYHGFVDYDAPLHWRQDAAVSGLNTMNLGMNYELLLRWVGHATRVMAMTRTFVPHRRDETGRLRPIQVPDHVDALADMACGAQAHFQFSAVTGLGGRNEAWLYGTQGTLHIDLSARVLRAGRRGQRHLQPVPIPREKRLRWRVEEEFVNAIRGLEQVEFTTFQDGYRYMEFTEAVARSAQTGQAVHLPLGD